MDSARAKRMGLRRRLPWMHRRDDEEDEDEEASRESGQSHRPRFLESAVQVLMNEEIDLQRTDEVPIDVSPFRVSAMMPMEQVYVLFAMLRCSRVFVTDYGRLVGVISQDILIDKLDAISKAPLQRAPSEFVPAHVNAGTIAHSASSPSLAGEEAGPDVQPRRLPALAHMQMHADSTSTIRPRTRTRARSLSDDVEPGIAPPEIELKSPRS